MRRFLLRGTLLVLSLAACQAADAPRPAGTPSASIASSTSVGPSPCAVSEAVIPLPAGHPSSEAWLAYLNAGGDPGALALLALARHTEGIDSPSVLTIDLTGDGRPDLLVATPLPAGSQPGGPNGPRGRLDAFVCSTDGYLLAWSEASEPTSTLALPLLLADVNLDGRQDVLLSRTACGAHTCFEDLAVLTWDGTTLANRWDGSSLDLPYPEVRIVEATDGAPQVQVTGTGFGSVGAGPYRPIRRTWRWDAPSGRLRVEAEERLPSGYRIHLLQDATAAESAGRTQDAADMYRRVMTDDQLLDWQDPAAERANLGAFAAFRLVRLLLIAGEVNLAEDELDALQSAHPAGADGHAFAEMGTAFRDSFASAADPAAACDAARQAVEADPDDILRRLDFGYANPAPTLAELCPGRGG